MVVLSSFIYSPGAADIASGAVTLTLTANGTNGQQASDIVVISFTPLPLAAVIDDVTVCSNDQIDIGAAPVAGNSYQWFSVPAGYSSTVANPTLD